MKIVVAPDSYKGSLTAMEVSEHIEKGILKVFKDAEVVKVPMADGGEGTVQSMIDATNGKLIEVKVHDPLMREINAHYGILGDGKTAVIEMAQASGLPLLLADEKNPAVTTTFGTGELILDALNLGCRKFIIGIGGSATNDGGHGMARALGVSFLDKDGFEIGLGGKSLLNLYKIDMSKMDIRLKECEFLAACDVDNPLVGERGASYIFGPQKGADSKMVELLDKSLSHYGKILEETFNVKVLDREGAGAAGGLGAGLLAFLNATLKKGIEIVIEVTHLSDKIKEADLVITGEGMIDYQTAFGKTPYGVAVAAKKYNVPVIAIAGGIGTKAETLYEKGFNSIFSIADKPMSLDESIKNCGILLENTAERIMRILNISLIK